MMFVYSVFLSVLVFSSRHAAGKTVSGVFSSDAARGNNGQYITRFLYHGENGLMACRVDDALMALQKEAKLLLFQGSQAFDNLSCLERLTSAHISISLSRVEQNQTMPHESRPQTWHVMYADRYTCQDMQISNTLADIPFQITMMNPDSAGNPLDHFSAEEAGLHSFFFLLMVSYFVASCIYAQPLWQTLSKGGPMNSVLKVLSAALLLQGSSVLLNYIHMARYARDGVGTPLTRSLAELCDTCAQVQMLYMLLSLCVGWSVGRSRRSPSKPLQWDSSPTSTALALTAAITQGALLVWQQLEDVEQHSFSHTRLSVCSWMLTLLRVLLALFLASLLYQNISAERSALKRDFYISFTKGCLLWFLCHPVLLLFSTLLNEHQKEKVLTVGVILCRSISVVVLYRLFLSRSLYWEVSSLSSVTLPLTMSRRSPY
nr:integral membrane protein GPR180 isoform X1 [Danio rerio]|eukprot:XP_002662615.5 integral membrane protein GPR180 isoform X1 [Danio rerio]